MKFDQLQGQAISTKVIKALKSAKSLDIRFNNEILKVCEQYVLANPGISFSALVRIAVGSFLASKGYY